ncbi:similar to Saccharomyces cerevisiae YHR102W KIC1 Protein kinase of the PAK/Ste20 family, required for cell integrity [Maudiozyma saulgeensis]|uniref:non-specific serine/threonine protein kinase n=1 Tax=Maudiozyma saulgeensis TaxID=1789683 RepID=A0A1X7QXD9_9SACH|nr:similar to Saccharomyces cerevisiae YHR102W KIC1 Protein kinase of the PAK/Ste20 family, required for cell integrity [Kazachstania saulgeensis]
MKKATINTNSMHNANPVTLRSPSASISTISKTKAVKSDKDVDAIFRRTEVVGRGKFGIVYKGYNIKTKQIYAIKVLNLDSDSDEVEDVQREIQFLASLKQMPNITRYYGSYLQNTSLWIIMEYCAGGSLRSLLRPGKIEEKYLGVIMRELLIALSFIHKDNIIHRDIKAANVLISNDGSVKLCDFGVAAQLNQVSNRRQTMAGTPYWMAPEVIMEGVYYDTKADIWSLGITAYEVATGNPPYCEVEALRVMQLITKSKPPRLEGKSYSASLKEFIALCLDEDANERPTADDLLKSKFIRTHKTSPTSVLKELITRYLLFRDKTKRDSLNPNVDGNDNKIDNRIEGDRKSITNGINDDNSEEDIDVKWDFDSLSSADYIVENNINIDNITNDTNYWMNEQHDNLNYAYPDEDQYMYYQTNNNANKTFYHGTTIGKAALSTVYYNSTLSAMPSHQNGTANINSTAFHGTGSHINSNNTGTGTHSNMNVDSNAPKQLLELFEENDTINEADEDVGNDLGRIPQNMSTTHMGSLLEQSMTPTADNNIRPVNVLNNGSFFSQSTTSLPVLQTKFNSMSKGPTSAITSIPTSIEIEIPEELPTSTSQPTSAFVDASSLHTKPRSSTLSTSPMPYKQPPGLSRRLTVSGNNNPSRGEEANGITSPSYPNLAPPPSTTIEDEIKKSSHSSTFSKTTTNNNSNNVNNGNISESREHTMTNAPSSTIFKNVHNTPSPSKLLHSGSISPNRKPTVSPSTSSQGIISHGSSNLGNPPTMKPLSTKIDSKNAKLHPLDTNMSNTSSTLNSTSTMGSSTTGTTINANVSSVSTAAVTLHDTTDENEIQPVSNETTVNTRNGTNSKRNNFNLKLQMPLPTTMTRNKLLDNHSTNNGSSTSKLTSNNISNGPISAPSENINQFGFNTKTTANIPVSMTPISEKHIDFGSKIKRSLSISNRKNSLSSGESNVNNSGNTSQHTSENNIQEIHLTNTENSVEGSNSKIDHTSLNNYIDIDIHDQNKNSKIELLGSNADMHNDDNILTDSVTSSMVTSTNNDNSNLMKEPPAMLDMSMFHDTSFTLNNGERIGDHERRRIDRRPQVLQELENLLGMFENSLPVLENTLKKMLQNPNDFPSIQPTTLNRNGNNNNNNTDSNDVSLNPGVNASPSRNRASSTTGGSIIASTAATTTSAIAGTPSPLVLDENSIVT